MTSDRGRIKKIVVRDAKKTLEVLFEISEAVTTTRDLNDLYRAIHHALGRILDVDNFYIALHNEEKDSISFPYHVDEKDDVPREIFNFSETASLTGQVIKAGEPLIFYDQDIIDFARAQNRKTIGTICKIWIGAPLTIKNRVIGVVSMQSYTSPDYYKKEDLNLLHAISQHIALAIERKESDEKLREQRKILEKILQSSPVGICLVENRIFKWVNNEMLTMFGYKIQEFKNAELGMIYNSEAEYEEAGKIISRDVKKKGKSDFDFNLKKKDGSVFKAHIILAGSNSEHPFKSTIVTFADISQRELIQKEKLEKEKLQGVLEMAGAVCHEINQPLQAIMGYSSLYQDDDKSSRELDHIKTQAARIADITKRLSNITKYKTMDYPGNTKIVDIWGS